MVVSLLKPLVVDQNLELHGGKGSIGLPDPFVGSDILHRHAFLP